MRCPSLNQLPPPPTGLIGWPWTEETGRLPDVMPGGASWPRLSIVTPSFNHGHFIEETIRSVLLQGYPNVEYSIMDGGSSDNTVETIKKYEKWLAHWVSEPDGGQAAAINTGFRRATGEVLQWINSDDLLTLSSLAEVARLVRDHPSSIIAGGCENFWPDGHRSLALNRGLTQENLISFWKLRACYYQPSVFVPAAVIDQGHLLDERLRYCFDLDWMIRLLKDHQVVYTEKILSKFRLHPLSKTCGERDQMRAERGKVYPRYVEEGDGPAKREYEAFWRRDVWMAALDRTLESQDSKATKLWRLSLGVCRAPTRLARRETLGTIRRIIFPSVLRRGRNREKDQLPAGK